MRVCLVCRRRALRRLRAAAVPDPGARHQGVRGHGDRGRHGQEPRPGAPRGDPRPQRQGPRHQRRRHDDHGRPEHDGEERPAHRAHPGGEARRRARRLLRHDRQAPQARHPLHLPREERARLDGEEGRRRRPRGRVHRGVQHQGVDPHLPGRIARGQPHRLRGRQRQGCAGTGAAVRRAARRRGRVQHLRGLAHRAAHPDGRQHGQGDGARRRRPVDDRPRPAVVRRPAARRRRADVELGLGPGHHDGRPYRADRPDVAGADVQPRHQDRDGRTTTRSRGRCRTSTSPARS